MWYQVSFLTSVVVLTLSELSCLTFPLSIIRRLNRKADEKAIRAESSRRQKLWATSFWFECSICLMSYTKPHAQCLAHSEYSKNLLHEEAKLITHSDYDTFVFLLHVNYSKYWQKSKFQFAQRNRMDLPDSVSVYYKASFRLYFLASSTVMKDHIT